MRVFVKSMRGKSLMPCSCRKARILLREKKAKIVNYKPFTIRLTIATGEATQTVDIGIDEGAKHIGVAIVSSNKVLAKGVIELRQDISELLDTRRVLRRGRRFRKTRYRKARWQNRRKPTGWLPPSLQARVNTTFFWIDKFCSLVPNPRLHIEVGKFDMAKMINPDISGVEYQQGQAYGYYDVRYYVFARDNYTCQVCKKKDKVLRTHHLLFRSKGGTDRADNLITVCIDCHTHEAHQPGGILYKWMLGHKKVKQYQEPPFMNAMRLRTYRRYPEADITYGSITTPHRKDLGLPKEHYNDAIAITGIQVLKDNSDEIFYLKQSRKKKRSLHESIPRRGRSTPNTTQKRNSKNTKRVRNFHLNDRVRYNNEVGWIFGFTGLSAYVKDINDDYIIPTGKSYKQISLSQLDLLSHNNGWQYYVKKQKMPIHPAA